MPLALLADLETRADAVTNIGTAIQENQMAIAGRVFNQSAAAYLGVQSPTVPVGTVSYPRINAGTTADVRNTGVELNGIAATLTTESINPVRLTASYTYSAESLVKVKGFEEALRRDIRGVLSEKRDYLAINGQSAVGSTSPALAGIINSLTNPTNPGSIAAWDDYLDAYDSHVDGKYASTGDQVRMLVNSATYKQARKLQIPTSGALLRNLLPADRFRVSAAMPAVASMIATGITYAAGVGGRGLLMPIWAGLELIVDPYSNAKKGQRLLTAVMMIGSELVDSAAYKRIEFKVA